MGQGGRKALGGEKGRRKLAGTKTERLGELTHVNGLAHSPMGTKTLRAGGRRERKSAPARWLPSLWGLEREGGSIENFLHTEEFVQSSERNSECE